MYPHHGSPAATRLVVLGLYLGVRPHCWHATGKVGGIMNDNTYTIYIYIPSCISEVVQAFFLRRHKIRHAELDRSLQIQTPL